MRYKILTLLILAITSSSTLYSQDISTHFKEVWRQKILELNGVKDTSRFRGIALAKKNQSAILDPQNDPNWEAPFFAQGPGGWVDQIALKGDSIVVAGGFRFADDVPAQEIALWDGSKWNALGKGLKSLAEFKFGSARNLLIDGEKIYVTGHFNAVGDFAGYAHDRAYERYEAKGSLSAFFDRRSSILHADRGIARQALGAFLNYSTGGGNRMVDAGVNFQTYTGALGVGLAFTLLENVKSRY